MPVSSLTKGVAIVQQLVFSAEEVADLKANLMKLTKARVIVRGVGVDEKTGLREYIEQDDNGIQLAATVKALEFAVGKPQQMLKIEDKRAGSESRGLTDLGKLLHQNPEIASKVIGALQDGLKVAQAIDVTATSAGSEGSPVDPQSAGSPRKG
jgi:hypothetical protein